MLCRQHRLRWQLRRAGGRDDPVVSTEMRDCEIAAAHTPRRSRHPEVAPDVSILRQAQDRYVALGRLSVRDRGNKTMLPGCS